MLNIVLYGPPGAGKGTQALKLKEKYHLIHLSTGDLLRSEIADKTELGMQAKAIMDKGQLVPDHVVIGMIDSKIKTNPGAGGFIFDGFPRTVAQALALDKLLTELGTSVTLLLSLDVDRKELLNRLLLRGKDSGRADDQNETVINNRIEVYGKETTPVFNYYAAQGKHCSVNGTGSIDAITQLLFDAINTSAQKS